MIIFLESPQNLTSQISAAGSWIDIDVSSYVPEGAEGVFLGLGFAGTPITSGRFKNYTVRAIESEDLRQAYSYCEVYAETNTFAFVKLDVNRKFQYYTDLTLGLTYYPILWLFGYSSEGSINYFTDAIDISLASTGWQDVDVSAYLDSTYNGVLVEIHNIDTSNKRIFDIRMKGDTLSYYGAGHSGIQPRQHKYWIVGLDSNRIFEFAKSHANIKIYLIGGIKASNFTGIKRSDYASFSHGASPGEWSHWREKTSLFAGLHFMQWMGGEGSGSAGTIFAHRQKGKTWDAPPYFGYTYEVAGSSDFIPINANGDKIYQFYYPVTKAYSNFQYAGGRIINPNLFMESFILDFSITPEIEGLLARTFSALAECYIEITPESVGIYEKNFIETVETTIQFISLMEYSIQRIIYEEEVDVEFSLNPEILAKPTYLFTESFETTINLNPETISTLIYNYIESILADILFIPQVQEGFGYGYADLAEVDIELFPSVIEEFYLEEIGLAIIEIIPNVEIDYVSVPTPSFKSRPKPITNEVRNLFNLHGQKILVFLAYRREADPYEKNTRDISLNPISIIAIVRDFSANGLIWREYGLKEIGAKELLIELKHIAAIKAAKKVQIKSWNGQYEDYVVYRDAVSRRCQIWERDGLAKVILEKV